MAPNTDTYRYGGRWGGGRGEGALSPESGERAKKRVYIVYSDYMGSGPGNKPSHGGNGYKIGSMLATVLSRLGLSEPGRAADRPAEKVGAGGGREGGTDGVESRAYARAEQEQSNLEKAKGSVDEGRPVYESKKRIAARPCDETDRRGRREVDARAREGEDAVVSRDEAGEEGRGRDRREETKSDEGKRDEGRGGGNREGRSGGGEGRGRGEVRRGEGQPQHREPSYWNLNNNYSV